MITRFSEKWIKKFWNRVEKTPTCWIWKGCIGHWGYGTVGHFFEQLKAHRVAWEIKNGPIQKGFFILHRCDNPPCVKNSHLFKGTPADNMRDMVKKRRQKRGEELPQSKFTPKEIIEIRQMYGPTMGYIRLSNKFGGSPSAIFKIVKRKSWKHIGG